MGGFVSSSSHAFMAWFLFKRRNIFALLNVGKRVGMEHKTEAHQAKTADQLDVPWPQVTSTTSFCFALSFPP
jgi:hypothetical protein